jgi:hypothetical protein
MHTTGIIHHFNHSDMYTNASYNIYGYIAHAPCCEFPLPVPFSTYLAPSRCDRNGPPQSQVARKLIPFVPHCSLIPSPPNSQPFLGFPELNVHSIRRHHKPSSQYTTHYPFSVKSRTKFFFRPGGKCSYMCVRSPNPPKLVMYESRPSAWPAVDDCCGQGRVGVVRRLSNSLSVFAERT